jgi:hypothetical protein
MVAPTATPSAYKLTNKPAEGSDTPRSAAIVGINPTITNSVVPIAKALRVNAKSAMGIMCKCSPSPIDRKSVTLST